MSGRSNSRSVRRSVRCTAVLLLSLIVGPVPAQSGGSFEIRRSTIDSGGGPSAAASFALNGSIGQPDASVANGGSFELRGGFWAASAAPDGQDVLFRDGFE